MTVESWIAVIGIIQSIVFFVVSGLAAIALKVLKAQDDTTSELIRMSSALKADEDALIELKKMKEADHRDIWTQVNQNREGVSKNGKKIAVLESKVTPGKGSWEGST